MSDGPRTISLLKKAAGAIGLGRRLRRRPTDPYAFVTVVFSRPDRDMNRLDIARGPCRATATRKRPLVGITNQQPGDYLAYEALLPLVAASPSAAAWQSTTVVPPGRLDVFSQAFVAALAEINTETLRKLDERPTEYEWAFEAETQIGMRWEPLVDWRRNVSTVWVAQRVGALCAVAREARDLGQSLYCWSGPGFDPWTPRLLKKYSGSNKVTSRRA